MIQTIVARSKFGPFPLGNPTLTDFPKHSNIPDTLNDLRVVSMTIFEVRTEKTFRLFLQNHEVTIPDFDVSCPREVNKLIANLDSLTRSERNPKPKYRLVSYDYVRG